MLSEKNVQEFQALYKNRYGKDLSYQEAYEQGMKLLTIMRHVYQPIPKNQ